VFAVPDFDPIVGGTTRQTRLQAEALVRRGHDVTVVTRRLEKQLPEWERVAGLDVVRLGPAGRTPSADRRALLSLTRWLARHRRKVEILQVVMWPDAALAAASIGLASRTALLWAIQGEVTHTLLRETSLIRRAKAQARRPALARIKHVTLTARMSDEFHEVGMEVDDTIIPVPVDLDHFRPPTESERTEARAALEVAPDAFTVLYVGHLQRRKAVDRLITAVGELRQDKPRIRLLVVGGSRGARDDTEEALRQQVEVGGLAEVVSFCGTSADPRRCYWAADVLALPSEREGMPNCLLEALACGVPCVAPASAGGAEVLAPDVGIVPPTNTPEDLRAALAALAGDEQRRRAMSARAREHVAPYGVERIADDYERLYARMTGR